MTTDRLIAKIQDKSSKQADIILAYSQALANPSCDHNWSIINTTIMDRWSRSGLKRIKQEAWNLKRKAWQRYTD